MSGNRISFGFLSMAQISPAKRHDASRVPLSKRLIARAKANQFDRMLAVGAPAPEGSALALHAAKLISTEEREAIARTLRRAVDDVSGNAVLVSFRVPLNAPNITAAADRIEQVTLRLHSPRPVASRGVARLRVLLADGTGPMYRRGRGDLEGRLGAALAAL
jgi:hypothetical protein